MPFAGLLVWTKWGLSMTQCLGLRQKQVLGGTGQAGTMWLWRQCAKKFQWRLATSGAGRSCIVTMAEPAQNSHRICLGPFFFFFHLTLYHVLGSHSLSILKRGRTEELGFILGIAQWSSNKADPPKRAKGIKAPFAGFPACAMLPS